MIETANANAFSLLNGLFIIETDFVASRRYESETNKTMARDTADISRRRIAKSKKKKVE